MSYRRMVMGFSLAMVVIGVAILLSTLTHGGGPVSIGFIMGIGFVGVGIGRFWVARRMSP